MNDSSEPTSLAAAERQGRQRGWEEEAEGRMGLLCAPRVAGDGPSGDARPALPVSAQRSDPWHHLREPRGRYLQRREHPSLDVLGIRYGQAAQSQDHRGGQLRADGLGSLRLLLPQDPTGDHSWLLFLLLSLFSPNHAP